MIGSRDRFVAIAGERLTQQDFYGATEAAVRQLEGSPYTRVAVLARPTMRTVVGVMAALTAGVEVVPVAPDSGTAELRHVLTDSTPQAWLGEWPESDPLGLPRVEVDTSARAWPAAVRPVPPERTAFVLYTSGTTGLPRGVVLSRRAVRADIDALAAAWRWSPHDVLAHGLPLFHVHGLVLGVLGPLATGGSLVHVGSGAPEAYASAAEQGATMYFAVPTIWSRIAERPEIARRLSSARLLVSGSAALPVPVFERLRELTGHEVVERYGMSESLITVATRADGERRAGWVGVPVAGVETRLVDDAGAPVPHDGESVGHLQVRGATLFDGYLIRPHATSQAFTEDGWFRTGDVAVIAPDGAHRIVGRESVDLIKSGGWRIGAGEIESTLLGHRAVAECAVVGVPDDDLGQRIVAHVVARDGHQPSASLADA
ncbi:MAG: AMP-binding protein, partial [Nocardioides sp.]|nr:AMP-binding protein [Nocardioides sp.]